MLVLVFGLKSALQSSVGGTSQAGKALDSSEMAQAQAICRQAFAPPLVRFPPGADDTALQSSAQQAGATLEPMLSQLESTITHSDVQPAATFMLAYRNLYSALAGFPESGGAAAAVNVGQLVQSVSAQARALDIPACAPG